MMRTKTDVPSVAVVFMVLAIAFLTLFLNFSTVFGGSGSGPENVIVICSSCSYPGLPQRGHVILMDKKTGEIWAYSDNAMVGKEMPVYVGTLTTLGQKTEKKK